MSILDDLEDVVNQRGEDYDPPDKDFPCIAAMWNALLIKAGGEITPEMVPIFQAAAKLSRLVNNPTHEDSMRDVAGYMLALDRLNASAA